MSAFQGIHDPENDPDYQGGVVARRRMETFNHCPYGLSQMLRRSLWLCGWHDTDIACRHSLYALEVRDHAA